MEDTPLHLEPVNTPLFDYDSDYEYDLIEYDYDLNEESSLDYQNFEPKFVDESITCYLSDIYPDLEEEEKK